MCPVDDVEVHHKVKHTKVVPGCYDRQTKSGVQYYYTFTGEVVMSRPTTGCRQIGRKLGPCWWPLPECEGCKSPRDEAYIEKARADIDDESAKFMKANQG